MIFGQGMHHGCGPIKRKKQKSFESRNLQLVAKILINGRWSVPASKNLDALLTKEPLQLFIEASAMEHSLTFKNSSTGHARIWPTQAGQCS